MHSICCSKSLDAIAFSGGPLQQLLVELNEAITIKFYFLHPRMIIIFQIGKTQLIQTLINNYSKYIQV